MGSVITNMECPVCKNPDAHEDYYYKSGEVYRMCPQCGYYESHSLKRDDKGKVVKDDNGVYEWEHLVIKKPFAGITISQENGFGSFGTLQTEEEFNNLLKEVVKNRKEHPDKAPKSIIVNKFVDGKHEKIDVLLDGIYHECVDKYEETLKNLANG